MFKDRKDAGIQLGLALKKFSKENPLVIGIPRGGIETAYYVAQVLHADMIPVISRKLGFPYNPEFAMGAIAEDGSLYLSTLARSTVREAEIEEIKDREIQEIKRRIDLLRGGKPLPALKDRTVIVVDDGIATGATLFATLEMCKKQQPKKLIAAAPISGNEAAEKVKSMTDESVILEIPFDFYAVSQGYDSFSNLSDEATIEFIRKFEEERKEK
ncbi:phosphoribosyltransferase [Algoriphagus sp. AK58]|uniref:phosphoribosyltransferase n=1 Tax=Algoriphagus sp. AK58 TaxID=1406877 RepID=UPI00164F868B|nr:phosphoribosyltransferase family protein [Algoriphagus sp. AK58]MBC6366892.1 phosphoribosyltransferase [Algoriphagus sp. AK58]